METVILLSERKYSLKRELSQATGKQKTTGKLSPYYRVFHTLHNYILVLTICMDYYIVAIPLKEPVTMKLLNIYSTMSIPGKKFVFLKQNSSDAQ